MLKTKNLLFFLIIFLLCLSLVACTKRKTTTFDGEYDNPLINDDVGGTDKLSLVESTENITLENSKIRIVFLKKNGGIKELVNKETKVYLIKNGSSSPIRINKIIDYNEIPITKVKEFSYTLEIGKEECKIKFSFLIANITILTTVSLKDDSDEIVFRISYEGNECDINEDDTLNNCLYNIEYPIIDGIDRLYSKERDHLITPFATGYLFDDPVGNFNGDFVGISKTMGLYPSGWEYSMQFNAYYSDGIGGFLFMTKDGGDTIKSFTFIGSNKKIRASIYHYLDDLALDKGEFDYDISISNLVIGNRYEALDKYRLWAQNQSWCKEKGKLSERDDINKDFYEDVAFSNFRFPQSSDFQRSLYALEKSSLNGGKILNVVFGKDMSVMKLSKDNNDMHVLFEFPDLHLVSSAQENQSEWATMVKTYKSNQSAGWYKIGVRNYFYECASSSTYRNNYYQVEKSYYSQYGVNGYYHDVAVAAVHPKQCFNTAHNHSTRVNVISDYVDQMKDIKELALKNNNGIYGQELIFEQMLPYIDFYQARSYADLLGWMESDRVRVLLEKDACEAIPVFDYVYGAYGARRVDGFLLPDAEYGYGYYYVAAFISINGGIPEYDFEEVKAGRYQSTDEFVLDRIEYLGKLYSFKKNYAMNYITYGEMVKSPLIDAGKSTYNYVQSRFEWTQTKEGTVTFDNLISASYRYNDKIGIIIANTSKNDINTNFTIYALKDYGIINGKVKITASNGDAYYTDIKDGEASINLSIKKLDLALIELEK